MEDSFVSGNNFQYDNPLPRSVSSTIAIAIACDGQTFGTTHGDHTVKIFSFITGQSIRVFYGHPRTPWTIKYHPTNPDILVSGCLGCQVGNGSVTMNCMYDPAVRCFSLIGTFHGSF
jgi:WD40 repeat protein